MKKKILLLGAVVLLLTGCGEVPKLENGKDAVVTFEDGKKISVDELYEKVKTNYALISLVDLIDNYVLETTFPEYVETAKEAAKSSIKYYRESFDSEQEFLSAIQNAYGLSSIDAFEELLFINNMQTHARDEYAKTLITEKQMKNYYKKEVVGDIEISHILITPEVTSTMKAEVKASEEQKAKDLANEIIEKLNKATNVSEEFEKLAKEYSDDETTKDKGGSLGRINKGTLSSTYEELVTAAYSLKDGEYTKKIVTTPFGYHIILKTKSYDKASYEDAKEIITTALVNKQIENDKTLIVKTMQYYRKKAGMEITDSTLKTQYAYYIQNQLSQE